MVKINHRPSFAGTGKYDRTLMADRKIKPPLPVAILLGLESKLHYPASRRILRVGGRPRRPYRCLKLPNATGQGVVVGLQRVRALQPE